MSNTRKSGGVVGGGIHVPHGDENPAAEAAMSRDAWTLPQNVILDGVKEYSAQDREDLVWFAGYVRAELMSSRGEACKRLGVDYSTVWRAFTGKLGSDLGSFMERIRGIKAKESHPSAGWVDTGTTRRIWAALDRARDQNAIVHICGPTGRSKTHTALEWRRRNYGCAFYVDCPAIGGIRSLLDELARCAGVNIGRKIREVALRFEQSLDRRSVIIVDEAVRLLPSQESRDVQRLEYLRRLADVRGIGLAFLSTNVLLNEMEHGTISRYLEQLLGRIEDPVYLPDRVSQEEAAEICRGFIPTADQELISLASKVANERGRLRNLFRVLRQGSILAAAKGEPLSTYHVRVALANRAAPAANPASPTPDTPKRVSGQPLASFSQN